MTNNTNNLFAALGVKAAASWSDASVKGDGGDALATEALYIAARIATFSAELNTGTKNEPIIETHDFDLSDIQTDPRNEDGTVNTKMKAARTIAIASTVFGITALDNATKQRLARCIKLALYLSERHALMNDDDYIAAVTTRQVKVTHGGVDRMTTCLVVPYGAIYAAPADDADDEEKANYERNKSAPKTLNGKDKASLAELGRRANPPKASRNGSSGTGATQDKGQSFLGAVSFVSVMLKQQLSDDGESDVALSTTMRRELFGLSQLIAQLFVADPITDDEAISEAA